MITHVKYNPISHFGNAMVLEEAHCSEEFENLCQVGILEGLIPNHKERTMACFLVPVAEAVVTTVAEKVIAKKEQTSKTKSPFTRKLKWLSNMLWGGSALLAFEHVWHGEVVPWFPFLTAANNPEDAAEMLHEMGTVGVTMAVLVTLVWLGMVVASRHIEKKAQDALPVQG